MKAKYLLATALLFSITSSFSYATQISNCKNDIAQMRYQINTYQSITTRDGVRFTSVTDPIKVSDDICESTGNYRRNYVCNIQWNVGDWGDTLHCV